MQKWEYLYVEVADNKIHHVNGEDRMGKLKGFLNLGGMSIWDFANQVGDDGWELVAILSSPYVRSGEFVFKRPKL